MKLYRGGQYRRLTNSINFSQSNCIGDAQLCDAVAILHSQRPPRISLSTATNSAYFLTGC